MRDTADSHALQQTAAQKRGGCGQGAHRVCLRLPLAEDADVGGGVFEVGRDVDTHDADDLADPRVAQLVGDEISQVVLEEVIQTLQASAHVSTARDLYSPFILRE